MSSLVPSGSRYGTSLVRSLWKPIRMLMVLEDAAAEWWRTRGWPPDDDCESRARERLKAGPWKEPDDGEE